MEVPKRYNETALQRFKPEMLSVAKPTKPELKPKPKPTYSVSAFPVRNATRADVPDVVALK